MCSPSPPVELSGAKYQISAAGGIRLARGARCRRCRSRRCRGHGQALDKLPPVHLSVFEVLEQLCDEAFH